MKRLSFLKPLILFFSLHGFLIANNNNNYEKKRQTKRNQTENKAFDVFEKQKKIEIEIDRVEMWNSRMNFGDKIVN